MGITEWLREWTSCKTATIKMLALWHHSSTEKDPILLGYDTMYIGM
jgi:hypothetical protein